MAPKDISVLLIDDEKSIRLTCSAFLGQVGAITDELENTQLGLDRINERYASPNPKPYDIVLTDLNQHPTGIEVVNALREYDKQTLCYIMTGGTDNPELLRQAEELAITDSNTGFLMKPINKTELHAIVEKAREHQIYQRPS